MRRWIRAGLGLLGVAAWLGLGSAPSTAHEGVPSLRMEGAASPDQVVPRNGAADPAGVSTAGAVLTGFLDVIDPKLDYRIFLQGLDLLTEVEGIHLRLGAPGENGPHVLNVWGVPGGDDSNLIVDTNNGVLIGIWDDGDENLGGDGVRDPLDSVALSSVIGDVLEGRLHVVVTTNAYSLPDSAEIRGQLVLQPKDGVLLERTAEHLATASDAATPVAGVRVFEGLTAAHPGQGGHWTNNPSIATSASPPGGLALGAGEVVLDVVVEPSTGRNLSYWAGEGPVVFGPVPGDEALTIHSGGASLVVDGGTEPVPGLALGTTATDGSGLEASLDYVLTSATAPTTGVYLAALRLRHVGASTPTSPSPRFWAVWASEVEQGTVNLAKNWIGANLDLPECSDGYENADGDGDADGADIGCASVADTSEYAASLPCDNGIDDDGDGLVDFPLDPQCTTPADLEDGAVAVPALPAIAQWGLIGALVCAARRRLATASH